MIPCSRFARDLKADNVYKMKRLPVPGCAPRLYTRGQIPVGVCRASSGQRLSRAGFPQKQADALADAFAELSDSTKAQIAAVLKIVEEKAQKAEKRADERADAAEKRADERVDKAERQQRWPTKERLADDRAEKARQEMRMFAILGSIATMAASVVGPAVVATFSPHT